MRKSIWPCALVSLLILNSGALAVDKGRHLNEPPPLATRELVKRAVILAESDKPWAAIAALKKAISVSPNYLPAHVEYGNINADYLARSDHVEAEYRSLVKRFPDNPVYLMALYFQTKGEIGRQSLQKVVELAPEWAWGHYAKALLMNATNLEGAVIELQRCIEKDGSALKAYETLIDWQENRLQRIDDAIQTAENLAGQTDIRAQLRLEQLWRLRLIKQERSREAKESLAHELSQLENSGEVNTLMAIRSAYLNLLQDSQRARIIELRILALDPSWTPHRGSPYRLSTRNQSQVPRSVVLVNRQIALRDKVADVAGATDISHHERIAQLRVLLDERPNAAVRRLIYEYIFQLAVRSGNATETRRYGVRLHFLDPADSALLSQMALVLADKKVHLNEALGFARRAEGLTATFRVARRPPNTSQMSLDFFFPEKKQREQYKKNRALALDAVGWTLTQMRQAHQAEPWLRQAIDIERSEGRLWHLATALKQLGRHDEASVLEGEANSFLADAIRKKFTNEPMTDLQLETIDGGSFKLKDQKDKVVLMNFWATWCGPCIQEMPFLTKLHEKYGDKELQIVAVSIDDSSSEVGPFAVKNKLNFPVVHSPALAEQLKAKPIPTTLFIDKQGRLRYRKVGFAEGDERDIEVVIRELLK